MKIPNINVFQAHLVIDHLVNEGVELFIISPGSRSAPLVTASSEHPNVSTKIIIDERAAAYFAVGYARSFGRAAGLICTSGTAAANYFPAIIEAYQSRLPLFVLTADRPEELQGRGANQTINQFDLYGEYACSVTFPAPDASFNAEETLNKLDNAIKKTWDKSNTIAGPVHLNLRFREPLAPVVEKFDEDKLCHQTDNWYQEKLRNESVIENDNQVGIDDAQLLIEGCRNGLIIAGPETRHRKATSIGKLSQKLRWPIITDILSQFRFTSQEIAGYPVGLYDLYIDIDNLTEKLKPEGIIQVGGLPTSKRLNQFLNLIKGIPIIKIQSHDNIIDPDHIHTHTIHLQEDEAMRQLDSLLQPNEEKTFLDRWLRLEYLCRTGLEEYARGDCLNEITIYKEISDLIPARDALFLSSSMPVRDADSFVPVTRKGVTVGCNRGVSGIDGVISSACGFAKGCNRPTTLIIGDLACMHDLTSLKIISESANPVIVIIINNNGGGIFHFLPIAEYDEIFEKYFAAPQNISFESTAGMYGLPYYNPKSITEFGSAYHELKSDNKFGMIEITIDRRDNYKKHEHIREIIRQKITNSELSA
ncbi:MAG: 2-succinyl-5-enolpyruvyl-6-hydroxy-3-cyclohexene-1-carboxylic-acid synthase [candidate division Zixibacteria bacterium]